MCKGKYWLPVETSEREDLDPDFTVEETEVVLLPDNTESLDELKLHLDLGFLNLEGLVKNSLKYQSGCNGNGTFSFVES